MAVAIQRLFNLKNRSICKNCAKFGLKNGAQWYPLSHEPYINMIDIWEKKPFVLINLSMKASFRKHQQVWNASIQENWTWFLCFLTFFFRQSHLFGIGNSNCQRFFQKIAELKISSWQVSVFCLNKAPKHNLNQKLTEGNIPMQRFGIFSQASTALCQISELSNSMKQVCIWKRSFGFLGVFLRTFLYDPIPKSDDWPFLTDSKSPKTTKK